MLGILKYVSKRIIDDRGNQAPLTMLLIEIVTKLYVFIINA